MINLRGRVSMNNSGKATIADIAKEAKTSTATVSRVFNESGVVSPELKEKILAAARDLGYFPNAVARSLRMKQTFTVGVIVSDIANSFFAAVVRGVEDMLFKHQYHPFICNSDRDPEKEALYLRLLIERRVDGVIISAASGEFSQHLSILKSAGIPWVFLNRRPADFEGIAILTDNRLGGYQGTSLLLDYGHRNIGVIAGPQNINTGIDRLKGHLEALRDRRIMPSEDLIAFGDFQEASGYQGAKKLLGASGITAMFVHNNQMTIGAIRAIREQNLIIPQDCSILAFDEAEWSTIVEPPITTIAQPTYEMGATAATALINAINKGQQSASKDVYLPPELNVRGSVVRV